MKENRREYYLNKIVLLNLNKYIVKFKFIKKISIFERHEIYIKTF